MRRWNTIDDSAFSSSSGAEMSSVSGLSNEMKPKGHSRASQ